MGVLSSVAVIAVVVVLVVELRGSASGSPVYQSNDPLERAKEILKLSSFVDGHNDFAYQIMLNFDGQLGGLDMNDDLRQVFTYKPESHPSQTDIPRMREGVMGAQLWSAFAPCFTQYKDGLKKGLEMVDVIKRFTNKFNETFDFVTDAEGMVKSHAAGKIASMIGLEGGHMIDNSLSVLRMYYELGVRYLTLAHQCDIPWADGYPGNPKDYIPRNRGLTDWGKRVVREMNRLGMIIDLSHVTFDTMRDSLNVSEAPVIFSHSQAYSVCPHPRNVPDDILLELKANNGIVMVNFYPDFINCTLENRYTPDNRTASLAQLADHIDHIRHIAGSDHVGLGAAFDAIDRVVDGVKDVSRYPYLFAELIRRGWSDEDLEKLAFKNFHRVLKDVEKVRDSKQNQAPDDTPINVSDIDPADRTCMTFSWDGSDQSQKTSTPTVPTSTPDTYSGYYGNSRNLWLRRRLWGGNRLYEG